MTTKSLEKNLKALGLSPSHVCVYLTSLESGPASASSLARKARVPRSSCYGLLDNLAKLGLISIVKGETKKIFIPSPPHKLKELLEERQKDLDESLAVLKKELIHLETLYQSHRPQLPNVRFYEGENGLKTVLYDGLSADEILVTCQGSAHIQTSLKDDPQYLKDFVEECALRQIKTREILEDTPAVRQYKEKYESKTNQIIITPPSEKTKFGHVDKHIYNDKIAFISHDSLVGVIIEDATLAASERAQFETLWNFYLRKSN